MALRKFNTIEHYFATDNSIVPGAGTEKEPLYPMSNLQTVLYANFISADPTNVMEVSFSAQVGGEWVALENRPMTYVGKVTYNGEEYHRWEFLISDDISYVFRPDRETILGIQYVEREISQFIGIVEYYEELLAETDMVDGDVAYVLGTQDEATYPDAEYGDTIYQYDSVNGWVAQTGFEVYGQIFNSSKVETTVAKGVRTTKSVIQTDTTDIVLKALAEMQTNRMLTNGTNSDIVELNFNDGTGTIHKLSYNDTDNTLQLTLPSGVTLQIGQEQMTYVRNGSTALPNGKPVSLLSTNGTKLQPNTIDPSNDATSKGTIGLVTTDVEIPIDGMGFVTTFGMVRNIDTSLFNNGDMLYVALDGSLTSTRPIEPNNVIEIGLVVTSDVNNGIIFVNPKIYDKVNDLSDVNTDTAEQDNILVRGADGVWYNSNALDLDGGL